MFMALARPSASSISALFAMCEATTADEIRANVNAMPLLYL
jgi:hypothetical protein